MFTQKALTIALGAIAVLSMGLIGAPAAAPQAASAGNSDHIVIDTAKIVWEDERIISSKITGRLDRRLVREGDEVNPGDVLAVLDDREAKIEHDIQDILANSELAILVQNEKLREYDARKEGAILLWHGQAISQEDYRLAIVNVAVNRLLADQEAEKHKVEQLKSARAKVILDDHLIVSPMKGVVQKCFKREKESVTPSDLQMFRIVSWDPVRVEATVPAEHLYRVRVGQGVKVRLTFAEGVGRSRAVEPPESSEVFDGDIVFKDPEVDFGNKRFTVHALVENRKNRAGEYILHAGLKAELTILPADSSLSAPAAGAKK
jgi:multidrug resistance efflux pump